MEKWPKLYTKLCQGHIFVCPNSAIISSQISFRFRGKVVYYLRCMSPSEFFMSMLSIVQDLRSKGGSNNWGFWLFNRQVANILTDFFSFFPQSTFVCLTDLPFIWNFYEVWDITKLHRGYAEVNESTFTSPFSDQEILELIKQASKITCLSFKTQFYGITPNPFRTLISYWWIDFVTSWVLYKELNPINLFSSN